MVPIYPPGLKWFRILLKFAPDGKVEAAFGGIASATSAAPAAPAAHAHSAPAAAAASARTAESAAPSAAESAAPPAASALGRVGRIGRTWAEAKHAVEPHIDREQPGHGQVVLAEPCCPAEAALEMVENPP